MISLPSLSFPLLRFLAILASTSVTIAGSSFGVSGTSVTLKVQISGFPSSEWGSDSALRSKVSVGQEEKLVAVASVALQKSQFGVPWISYDKVSAIASSI